MARVPYQPFATAQPITGGERVQESTPGAAFGENIAAALGHIGSSMGQAGNQIFQQAIAIQDLKNENDARDAQTEFATKSSELHAQYGALTGKAAADGLQPFLDAQTKLRTDIGGRLNNPMAKRFYDADTLPFMQRNVFSAAGHAADENKKYTIDTLNSQADLAVKSAGDFPDSPDIGTQAQRVAGYTSHAAQLKFGVDENSPIVKDAVANATSRFTSERILGKARTDPIAAEKMFEEYGDGLTGPDRDRVQGTLETRSAAVAGVNIAQQVFNAHRQPDGTYDATVKQMQDEVRQKAADAMPNNKLLPDVSVGKLDGLVNQDRYSSRQDAYDTQQQVDQAIAKYNVTDVQSLLAIPGMDKTVGKLPADKRNDLQGYINRFNDAAHKTTREDTAIRINGLANNDVEKFLDTDLTKLDLSKSDMIKYQNKQAELAKTPRDDPRVGRAMSWLRGGMPDQLQALGLMQRDHNSPDDYDHFTGALQEALQIWQEDHKKPPSYEEVVDKIGPMLIQQHSVKGWLWNNQEPTFRGYSKPMPQDVPQQFKDKLIDDVVKAGGAEPSDIQIYQAYLRQQFNDLYKGAKPDDGRPNVPISK